MSNQPPALRYTAWPAGGHECWQRMGIQWVHPFVSGSLHSRESTVDDGGDVQKQEQVHMRAVSIYLLQHWQHLSAVLVISKSTLGPSKCTGLQEVGVDIIC